MYAICRNFKVYPIHLFCPQSLNYDNFHSDQHKTRFATLRLLSLISSFVIYVIVLVIQLLLESDPQKACKTAVATKTNIYNRAFLIFKTYNLSTNSSSCCM